jgi:hypothetical protein
LLFENIKLFVKYKEVDAQHQQNIIKIENEKQKEEDIMKEMEKLETVKGQEWIMIEKGNFMKPGEKKIQIIDY